MALGRRLHEGGAGLLGFVGRRREAAEAAVAFCGAGRVLTVADLAAAAAVVLAVGDDDLSVAVAAGQAAPPRRCSLWLHTSGRHDLGVLAPLAGAGARVGALHPLCPFPDPLQGYRRLPGQPALWIGDPRSGRLLVRLIELAGMRPVAGSEGDRALYHAACALAANGLTALRDLVDQALLQSGVVDAAAAATVGHSLMEAALAACRSEGPAAALSGPVRRGDAATVAAHRAALTRVGAPGEVAYRGLMLRALQIAEARGLDAARAAAVRAVLTEAAPGSR